MNPIPAQTSVPTPSAIAAYLPGAYFHDAWTITAGEPSLSALGQLLKALQATPPWVNTLMTIRNHAVAAFGLKNLGTLSRIDPAKPASAYLPGDRVGIFTLTVTTVVHVHNWFGVLYMLPVTPMHRIISKTVLKAVGH